MNRLYVTRGHITHSDGSITEVSEREMVMGEVGVDFSPAPKIQDVIRQYRRWLAELQGDDHG